MKRPAHLIGTSPGCHFGLSSAHRRRLVAAGTLVWLGLAATYASSRVIAQVPEPLKAWLTPQEWERDTDGPILTLGERAAFDDTHIFAPMVAREKDRFLLWYCGSRGFAHDLSPTRTRDERVFKLGLATSADGKRFERHPGGPVYALETKRLSILTPTVLRRADGLPLREDGLLRMWFSSATLGGGGQVQSIQHATSTNGYEWSRPSPVLLERAYAPSVIRTESGYEMWYTVPGRYPWVMRHARSDDGLKWNVTEKSVLEISQDWEHYLQIYPAVIRVDGVYLMWYASYLSQDRLTTAIGFAASLDGINWHKHPQNPVLRPDPKRDWESHYVSSQSVIRLSDGSFRMWYASRKKPPFHNLYFALNTARWSGPRPAERRTTYVNPVGGALRMGDPFALRHGGRYYLYGTNAPDGFKYWTSSNLRDWKAHGYAYRRNDDSWGGKTFWAPEVLPYRGRFYMIYSSQPRDAKAFAARICLAVADDPGGPFTDLHAPLFDLGWSCIDGHLFVDDDGRPYLFFDRVGARGDAHSSSADGYLYGDIYCVELEKDFSGPLGKPTLCLRADQPWELSTTPGHVRTRTNEGSFVFKRGAGYYLTYSSHHYADPLYGIGYATAKSPLGPWTKSAANPLVAKDLSIGVSGPGHSSITTSPDGTELFLVYHTHADVRRPSGNRTVNIDRLSIDEAGRLKLRGPTRSPQPLPSGADGAPPSSSEPDAEPAPPRGSSESPEEATGI